MRVPLKLLSLLGAKSVVLTSAAGSVSTDINPGTLVSLESEVRYQGRCESKRTSDSGH